MVHRITKFGLVASLVGIVPLQPAFAQSFCELEVGKFVSIDGSVSVQSGGNNSWVAADLTRTLCEGEIIKAGDRCRAVIALINDAVLRIA